MLRVPWLLLVITIAFLAATLGGCRSSARVAAASVASMTKLAPSSSFDEVPVEQDPLGNSAGGLQSLANGAEEEEEDHHSKALVVAARFDLLPAVVTHLLDFIETAIVHPSHDRGVFRPPDLSA